MLRRNFLKGLFALGATLAVAPKVVAETVSNILPFKGKTAIDAGCFYCPYIPLVIARCDSRKWAYEVVDEATGIIFQTRYSGAISNQQIVVYKEET